MTATNHRRRTRALPIPSAVLGHDCHPARVVSVRDDDGRLLARCCECGAVAPMPEFPRTRKEI